MQLNDSRGSLREPTLKRNKSAGPPRHPWVRPAIRGQSCFDTTNYIKIKSIATIASYDPQKQKPSLFNLSARPHCNPWALIRIAGKLVWRVLPSTCVNN
jgi:hypothetical protein